MVKIYFCCHVKVLLLQIPVTVVLRIRLAIVSINLILMLTSELRKIHCESTVWTTSTASSERRNGPRINRDT